jgi:hypothetical protein
VIFTPDRRQGTLFHLAALVILSGVGLLGLLLAADTGSSPLFLLFLAPALLALSLIPWFIYRYFSLRNAQYTLEREGLRLRWGLRIEEIPMENVLWVRPVSELGIPMPLPRLRWPGAVIGSRSLPEDEEVEYLAGQTHDLVLIATPGRGFAISPADPPAFLHAFQHFLELGTLAQLPARSVYPASLLGRVWTNRAARGLVLVGLGLSLALWIMVAVAIPTREQVLLGFSQSGQTSTLAPAVRLVLLPVLNTGFVVIDLLIGLFFFRRENGQSLAYLLWTAGVVTPLLFLLAVAFILAA